MAQSVEMPELGESVTEGTITRWLKQVGDTVEVDEPLLEVSTDKVDTEIPSPAAGVILEIKAEEDETVDVGETICVIGDEDESPAGDDDSGSDNADNDADDEADDETTDQDDKSSDDSDDSGDSKDESSSKPKSSGSGKTTDVAMPELGESVTEGTITRWLKQVGDTVEVDEPLLEVSTDKVDTEVPSPEAGTIVEILFEEDETVDVGEIIVRIGDPDAAGDSGSDDSDDEEKAEAKSEAMDSEGGGSGDDKSTETPDEKNASQKDAKDEPKSADTSEHAKADGSEDKGDKDADKAEKAEKAEPKKPAASKSSSGSKDSGTTPYVTPLVRKLADKHGVDLSTVEGTGIGGRIRKQDVLRAAEGDTQGAGATSQDGPKARWSTKKVDPAKQDLIGTTQKVNRIREITAKKTLESLHGAAQLTQVHEVDMTKVAEIRKANKKAFADKHGVNLTYLPFIAKAICEALVSHPNVNASYNANTKEMTYHGQVNLGIAVDTEQGLLSPVIHNAQDMSLPELAKAIVDIADRARTMKLKPNDLSGGTFTITNIGSEGALTDTPILVPPQAAMIGTGAIVKRPVVITEDGVDAIAVRQMVFLPMTYDHQVVDGADAGRFMTTVRDRLETADFEADLEL